MATTRIDEAQDQLKSLIRTQLNTDGATLVPVDLGYPQAGAEAEHVWVTGNVTDWTQQWASTGTGAEGRDETFVLEVVVVVTKTAEDYLDVRNRLLTLVASVETAVRNNKTLALPTAIFEAQFIGGDIGEGIDATTRQATATMRVFVRAFV